MELRDYLRLVRRRWTTIVACVLAVVALAVILTLRATPQYSSTSRVFISASQSDNSDTQSSSAFQGGQAAQQRVASYAQLVTDGELTQRVVKEMNLDLTPAQLAGKIQAKAVPETVLLSVSVTDPDPKMAQRIDRAVVQQLLRMIAEIETPPGGKTPLIKGTVTGPATLPTAAVSPNTTRNIALGLVLGLLLGLAVAVIRELLDTSLKNGEDLEELTTAPVLGGISFDPQIAKHPLVTALKSHDPRVEAFRVLRTNLQFVDIDSHSKVFVVTSSVPGEGKSTTSANVALTLAQAGQRVLLVDCDLRRPQVANIFGLESHVGVTTVLLGRIGLDDAIQDDANSPLKILTSGATPPNPAELLQSHAMTALLEEMRSKYDVIILDSPPLLPVTDAALLASQTDGAILVVRHGKTTKDQAAGAANRLEQVGGRLLGSVFNRVPAKGDGYGYGYGYGYAPTEDAGAEAERPRRRLRMPTITRSEHPSQAHPVTGATAAGAATATSVSDLPVPPTAAPIRSEQPDQPLQPVEQPPTDPVSAASEQAQQEARPPEPIELDETPAAPIEPIALDQPVEPVQPVEPTQDTPMANQVSEELWPSEQEDDDSTSMLDSFLREDTGEVDRGGIENMTGHSGSGSDAGWRARRWGSSDES